MDSVAATEPNFFSRIVTTKSLIYLLEAIVLAAFFMFHLGATNIHPPTYIRIDLYDGIDIAALEEEFKYWWENYSSVYYDIE